MRSSLSCAACRKSKIKCIHDGHAPCQRCGKFGYPSCELTRPRAGPARRLTVKHRVPDTTQSESSVGATTHDGVNIAISSPAAADDLGSVGSHLQSMPICMILKILLTLSQNFPEMAMIHPDLFRQKFQDTKVRSAASQALLATLLALVKQLNTYAEGCELEIPHTSEEYALFARSIFATAMLESPDVVIVQAHIILTWYEWGIRDFQKAWIHCGIAIRIMQSLQSMRNTPVPLNESHNASKAEEITEAVEAATYWACYVLDCTINCGAHNPRMLAGLEMHRLQAPRPPSSSSFFFGSKQYSIPLAGSQVLGVDRYYEILVDGFSHFSDAMTFTYNDGRKAPGMCAPGECPWMPGSRWAMCRQRLEAWRDRVDNTLRFPAHSLGAHAFSGSARCFAYVNLLYYHTILMLQREYFPFLPRPDGIPQGPTDPPLLEADAPSGWWENSARELFEAAERVTMILQEASDWGLDMLTPVPAFCGFSACYMNNYALYFPNMTCGYSSRAEELVDMGMRYLYKFKKLWPLGTGWVRTVENASSLFNKVNEDAQKFRNRSRRDFEALHRSAHEFRTIDRSEEHLATIRSISDTYDQPENSASGSKGTQEHTMSLNTFNTMDYIGDQPFWPTWDASALYDETLGIVSV